jgi:hypothetical protein
MARLILREDNAVREFPLAREAILGRQEGSTVRLAERKASRQHARIWVEGADYVLEDLASSNGTRVNGRKVLRWVLRHGDTIQIGKTRLLFDEPERKDSPRPKEYRALARGSLDDPLVGRELGRFKLLAKLGEGSLGVVYGALESGRNRVVALRVLKPEVAAEREFVRDFCRLLAPPGQLSQPGLVEVYDAQETAGHVFCAMELVDGESLHARLAREGRLPPADALAVAARVCEILVNLSSKGAVHQGLKPQAILLGADGQVKLAAMGLAALRLRHWRAARHPDLLLGAPGCLAPELTARDKHIDPRADLYSLGCVLFHMLTGRAPFDGPDARMVLTKHANQTRPDPRQLRPETPSPLARLVVQLMAIEPGARPGSAEETARLLARVSSEAGIGAGSSAGRMVQLEEGEPAQVPAPTRRRAAAGSAARLLFLAGLLVVLGIAGFHVARLVDERLASRPQQPPPDVPAPPIVPKPGPIPKANVTAEPPRPIAKKDQAQAAPPAKPDEQAASAELRKALEKRDRALQSGNFAGARAALTQFREQYRSGQAAERADAALLETEKEIAAASAQLFQEAQQAAAARNYRTAAAKCTRLISADPAGDFAGQARALMGRIDQQTEPRHQEVNAQAGKALDAGRLDEALRSLSAGLDELGGTCWAEALTARQLQIVLAQQFLKECEKARQAAAAQGKAISVTVPGLDGKPASAVLRQVSGLTLKAELRSATVLYHIKRLLAADWLELARALGLADRHLALANLFAVLGNSDAARKEMEQALRDPQQAAEAARLALARPGLTPPRLYDFSKWQHQADWEAPLGAWSIRDGQYALESPEGGETCLKTAALGGPLAARGARLGFEFTPGNLAQGYYISAEFGDAQRQISLLFTAGGLEVQVNSDERVRSRGAWSGGPTRVELACDGDLLTLVINGAACEPIRAPGLEAIQGTLSFRVREATCAFDNVFFQGRQ